MEEDYWVSTAITNSETPTISMNSGGGGEEPAPAEVAFITAVIKKISSPIIICTFIHRLCSISTSFNLSLSLSQQQQSNITCSRSTTPPTALGNGEYIKGSNPDDDGVLKCVICLCEVVKGEKYRVLGDCKHGFHVDCIEAWLQNNSSCPLCRSPVPYASGSSEDDDRQTLHDAVLSYILAFVDHLFTWFLNPLGFDDPATCEEEDPPNYHHQYVI